MTSRPTAKAASTIMVAAALLLTTTAASAPVKRQSSASACTSRRPRLPRMDCVMVRHANGDLIVTEPGVGYRVRELDRPETPPTLDRP